jgi:hypothetical protein
MQIVGLVISWAVAIGIIGIGIGYAAKSEMNATGFGLPQLPEREARGWWPMSALPPKADMDHHGRDVCFVPKADMPLSTNSTRVTASSRRGQCAFLWGKEAMVFSVRKESARIKHNKGGTKNDEDNLGQRAC